MLNTADLYPVGKWFWLCPQYELSRSSPASREMRRSDSLHSEEGSPHHTFIIGRFQVPEMNGDSRTARPSYSVDPILKQLLS